jgi:MFS family permease
MVFNIQRTFSISDAGLGLLLALAIALAGASSAVMGHLADRVGARRLLWMALLTWSVLLVVMSSIHQRWGFVVALVVVEIAGGSIDTAMNAEASHRLIGNPAGLVRFHALFNVGAIVGAAGAGLVLHAGISWRWVWPGVALVALIVGLWTWTTDDGTALAGSAAVDHAAGVRPIQRLRGDGLLVLLAVFALAEVTEGGVDTWGVLYLRNHLAAGVLLGGGQRAGGTPLGPPRPACRRLRGRRRDPARIALPTLGPGCIGAGPGGGRCLPVLAAGHEQRLEVGHAGGQRRGDLHGGRVHRVGGGGAHRRMDLPGLRPAARIAGAGGGGLRRGGGVVRRD